MDDDGVPRSTPTTVREARAPSQQAQALLYTTWWALQRHHAAVRRARAAQRDPPPASQALLELHRRTSTLDEDGRRVPVGAEAPYTWKLAAFFYRTVEALHEPLRAAHSRGPEQLVNLLMRAEIAAVRDDGGPHALQQLLGNVRARWPHLRLTAAHRIALYEHLYVARIARWLHAEEDRVWAATHLSLQPRGLAAVRRAQLLADVRTFAETAAHASLGRLEALATAETADEPPGPTREWQASAHPEVPDAPRRRYPRLDVQESGYLLAALWSDPFSPIKHEALAWLWRATRPDAPALAPAAGPSGRLRLPGEVAALLGCSAPAPAVVGGGPTAANQAAARDVGLRYAVHSVLYQTLLILDDHAEVRDLLAVEGPAVIAHVRDELRALADDFRRNLDQLQAHALTFLNQCTYLLQYLLYERLRTWATERAAPPVSASSTRSHAADSFLHALVAEVTHEIGGRDDRDPEAGEDEASSSASASEDSAATARRTAFAALAAQLRELATQCRALLKDSLAAEATRRRDLTSAVSPRTRTESRLAPPPAPRTRLRPRRGTSPEDEALVPALSRTLSSYLHTSRAHVRRTSSSSPSSSASECRSSPHGSETGWPTAETARTIDRDEASLELPSGETDSDDLQAILDELAAPPVDMAPLEPAAAGDPPPIDSAPPTAATSPIRWNRTASPPRAAASSEPRAPVTPAPARHQRSASSSEDLSASDRSSPHRSKKGLRRILRRATTVSSHSRSRRSSKR